MAFDTRDSGGENVLLLTERDGTCHARLLQLCMSHHVSDGRTVPGGRESEHSNSVLNTLRLWLGSSFKKPDINFLR